MKQDGKEYRPITELSKADADALLEKAAVSNEQNGFRPLILYAFPLPHSAKLFATPFAKVARTGGRMIEDVQLVPMTPQTAKVLMGHNDATLKSYLAIDPTQYPDTHPFADHIYVLDVPQTITREQVYFRRDDDDAKIETAPGAKVEAVKGLTKGAVINAFEGLHFDADKWSKYLASPPKWLEECRVARGSKKASALWNPMLIATALFDKKVPIKKLDAVFIGLKDWQEEWQEESALFRD